MAAAALGEATSSLTEAAAEAEEATMAARITVTAWT